MIFFFFFNACFINPSALYETVSAALHARRAFWLIFIITMGKDFESANSTHCKVYNFMPSFSSCIGTFFRLCCDLFFFNTLQAQCSCAGGFFPQAAIWRGSVMLFIGQRIIAGFVCYHVFAKACANKAPYLNTLRLIVHCSEQASLILLSAVSSTDYKPIHEVLSLFINPNELPLWPTESNSSLTKHRHNKPYNSYSQCSRFHTNACVMVARCMFGDARMHKFWTVDADTSSSHSLSFDTLTENMHAKIVFCIHVPSRAHSQHSWPSLRS